MMSGFTRFALVIFVLAWGQLLQARVIVVSDLDDTVRIANSKNKADALKRLLLGVKPFPVMQRIFQEIDQEKDQTPFIYVSASYYLIYNAEKWLDEFAFPAGDAIQRRLGQDRDKFEYKVGRIVDFLVSVEMSREDTVWFFGDNFELDPDVYLEVAKRLEIEDHHIYIRDVEAEATEFTSYLPVKKLPGVTYFFSEYELVGREEFSSLSREVHRRLQRQREEGSLIPDFVQDYLYKRVKKALCDKDANALVDFFCSIRARNETGTLIQNYLDRF